MLRAFVPDADQTLVPIDLDAYDPAEHAWVWIDVMPETGQEVVGLGARFGLHHLAVEDASSSIHFPKVDDFGDHLLIVLHGITEHEGRLETAELDAFLGPDYLITVHFIPSPSAEWVLANASSGASGPDVILARLADTSGRRLLPLIEALDQDIDDLEERAVGGDGGVVPEIQALRRDAVRLRRVVGPQRSVLSQLSRPFSDLVGNQARLRFASAHDHLIRVVENLDGARMLLGSTLETYRGTVAERMNEVMKVLTVYAAILLPLSLLAGIYGMNFTNMPELKWRWGYFALLGVMGAVAVGQWVYFARRGFIGAFSFRRIPRTMGRGLARIALLPVDAVTLAVGELKRFGDRDAPDPDA